MDKPWDEMSNDELRNTIKDVCNFCSSKSEVNRIMKERHGYPFTVSVTYSEPYNGMQMNMFMAHTRDGKTLS